MALSNQEQAALLAAVSRDGLQSVVDQLRDVTSKGKKDADSAAIGAAVTVTVSDWKATGNRIASADNSTLLAVVADILAAWTAKDQTKLGPLFVQLIGGARAHFGL